MVITDRIQTDNTSRVTPICSKRSSNIRVTNPYDSNCDTASNNRFSQNYEPSVNTSTSHMNQIPTDFQNQNLTAIKKDRIYSENINEGKLVNNIRLSCSPVTWSTNTCTSQSSEINKSDMYNRQFSPWTAPVRNRVVARVDPFTHTSSNTHNSSQANSNLLSKTIQSSTFINRVPNTMTSHNVSRNVQKTLSSFPEKEFNVNVKQENVMSVSKSLLHPNDRDFGSLKRRTNYNQPLTYRIAKNPENISKSFSNRTPIFSGIHKVKTSKNINYKVNDLSENLGKQITTAEIFGADFSDLSDSDSASSYVSNNRKRKQKLSKCKSPSIDSSSTISVLSSEKQNRFIRVSKVQYHSNKSIHLKSKRSKSRLKSNKFLSENLSSDEPLSELLNSSMKRHKMKLSLKENADAMNSSMKPLSVNVSLSNFEDNPMESDVSSAVTDNSSVEIPKKCLNIGKKPTKLSSNKRKLSSEKTSYQSDNLNASSSSDNEQKSFKRKYKANLGRKPKSFVNDHEERKRTNSYVIDRRYKDNKFVTKVPENRTHKMKLDNDHSKSKMVYNSGHNYLSTKSFNEKDDKNSYASRNRHVSDSPPVKRKKTRHEEISKGSIYRSCDKKLSDSMMDLHSTFKRHEYQQASQEISSDAVFQKEFDEFKRDQASDQSSVHRKGNSSKVSSASSVGIKTFSSYEKYKSQKSAKSKINSSYTTSPGCKNIFQIDMNNINMCESMYDKVKRRAQKQAETKINRNSPEINEPRNKRKNKISEHKHKSSKENKMFYKRHKKQRDVVTSPASTAYSDDSALVDDSQSNYSSTMYVASEKDSVHRNKTNNNRKFYKSTKNSTVSSFESPNSFSANSWKRSRNKDEMLRIFKYSNKPNETKYGSSKKVEHEYENENEEHESISEFSFKTNTSNANFSTKPIKEYMKGELEEVANISDATASTEPMEYAEVDLESLKMSDDDWKSGLSSQSSSESGNNLSKIEMQQVEVSMEKPSQSLNEKQNLSDKNHVTNFPIEDTSELNVTMKKDDDNLSVNKMESVTISPTIIDTELKNELKEDRDLIEVENQECVKEEQDIAIASIMLKEENDSKSPIDWKSNLPHDSTETSNSINPIFGDSCSNECISTNYEITLINTTENNADLSNNEFQETDISESVVVNDENVSSVIDSMTNNLCHDNSVDVDKSANTCSTDSVFTQSVNTDSHNLASQSNICITNSKINEPKLTNDQPITSNNETAPSENPLSTASVNNSRHSSKTPSFKNNNTSEKIDLTSYVKGVIEQVKREQSAENQNKLKVEKNPHKRIKKLGSSTTTPCKSSHNLNNSGNNNLPVTLLTLQKSPTVSLQSSIIENSDLQIPVISSNQSVTPNIPGVNVCSPVTNVHVSLSKPNTESPISLLPELPIQKTLTSRSNVISIINLPSVSSLKTEYANNSLSELKINTELNTFSTAMEINSSNSDSTSAQLSNASLKSPVSEDHTKQRICTRLRRADPTKSDSNYKIVTSTCVTKSDINLNNNNNQSKSNGNESNQIISNKSLLKHPENICVTESVSLSSDKISDPYEPNFDESPLEFSRFRSKTKNTFFPNDSKSSKMSSLTDDITSNTPVSSNNTSINNSNGGSTTNSGIDSVSQIIEDVVHGNFNYSEYLTSFKSGKLSSHQISPSTTPLTFVSNDSRDCSSVSAENLSGTNFETGSTFRKYNTTSKTINPISISIDEKKPELFSVVNNSCSSGNKQTVTLLTSLSTSDLGAICNAYSTNKICLQKENMNSNFVSKSNTQSISVSPVFNSSNTSQINTELLAFINLYKSKEPSTLIPHEAIQQQQKNIPISSIQLQSFERDVSSLLSSTCTPSFDKSATSTSKLTLNVDSKLPQTISNNLLNITVNSQMQQTVNPMLASVHNSDENNPFKQLYFNILQGPQLTGLAVDSSTLSKLQTAITESTLKNINPQTDSNSYRNVPIVNPIDPLSISKETNQDSVYSNLTNSQNISSKTIADLIIPRVYPLVWEGKLSLKNEEAKVALHFVHGNTELLNACMHLLIFSGSLQWNNTGSLKIVQRMRLDLSQLEGVQRRMQNSNEFCIGLALPGGDDIQQLMKQSQILKEGFIKYMKEKGAAGIINVCHPENNQQGLYVVHIFPPCEFSTNQLHQTAPDLQKIIEMNKFPSLLVVITTV